MARQLFITVVALLVLPMGALDAGEIAEFPADATPVAPSVPESDAADAWKSFPTDLFRSMVGWASPRPSRLPAQGDGTNGTLADSRMTPAPDPLVDDEGLEETAPKSEEGSIFDDRLAESSPQAGVEDLPSPADQEKSSIADVIPSPAPAPIEPPEEPADAPFEQGGVNSSRPSIPQRPSEPSSLNPDWTPAEPPAPADADNNHADNAPGVAKTTRPPESAGQPSPSQSSQPSSIVASPVSQVHSGTETPPEEVAPAPDETETPPEHIDSPQAVPFYDNECDCFHCNFERQFMPEGLLYKSYLAGEKEPRFASQWLYEEGRGLIWESAIGGRVGLYRNGTCGPRRPQGFQIDLEGAVFSRIDPEEESDLDAADFRFGVLMTRREGPIAWKYGYYHISSHVGDEFLLRNPGFDRVNYVRDSAIVGVMRDMTDDFTIYAEAAYAPSPSGGAEPLEFQFGAQYSSLLPSGKTGDPFAAVNIHLREEFDFGGSINAQAGWQWRSVSDRLLRVGVQHYNGKSMQYSFFDQHESLTGLGIWLDY